MDNWQDYFGHPTGSKLGILNSIYQIGSIASFPFAYVIAIHGDKRHEVYIFYDANNLQTFYGGLLWP